MKKLLPLILLIVCFPAFAFADTTPLTPVASVASDIFQIVGYGLGLVLMGLLTFIVNKLKQKYNIQVPAAWLASLNQAIDSGIAYAEEQANKAVGSATALTSNDKLNAALGVVKSLVGDDPTIVAKGEAWLKQMIEARLNQTRPVNLSSDAPAATK